MLGPLGYHYLHSGPPHAQACGIFDLQDGMPGDDGPGITGGQVQLHRAGGIIDQKVKALLASRRERGAKNLMDLHQQAQVMPVPLEVSDSRNYAD